jgi:glycosyltransferase involved in cell wall biosynthesis
MNETVPLVSVFCATYNHGKYIGKAIEGFLMQKTNFNVEIIICEDKSTDNTASVIASYEKKAPGKLKVFYHTENLYSQKIDFFKTEFLTTARGKYYAFCEGDDYWTDPLKLQKQVDVLEQNQDCSFAFHNTMTVFENGEQAPLLTMHPLYKNKTRLSTDLLIDFDYNISTASMLMRSDALLQCLRDGYETNEKALQLWLSTKGDIIYLNDTMSVYRLNDQSVSYNTSKFRSTKVMMAIYNSFNTYSDGAYATTIRKRKTQLVNEYLYNRIMNERGRIYVLLQPVLLGQLIFYKIRKYFRVLKLNYLR